MALTDTQLQNFLEYVRSGKYYKHYDEFVILSGTGLRVSEMCGLTLQDVDFINNRICVNKQLLMDNNGNYYIEKPKTSSSNRYIPMSPSVRQAFQRTIQSRNNPRVEHMINGVTGFVFLTRNKTPKVAEHIRDSLRTILRVYNKTHTEPLCITPHVFRHTFITNMLAAGLDLKSVQYIVGHDDAQTTLNVYAHSNFDTAAQAFNRIRAAV